MRLSQVSGLKQCTTNQGGDRNADPLRIALKSLAVLVVNPKGQRVGPFSGGRGRHVGWWRNTA